MSNGLNLLHPRKDVAEMVIVFCVSLIVPEDLMFAIKSGEHVYQESSFFVSPLSFLRVSWWYQVSMSWCNCSKMSEVLAGAHMKFTLGPRARQQSSSKQQGNSSRQAAGGSKPEFHKCHWEQTVKPPDTGFLFFKINGPHLNEWTKMWQTNSKRLAN